MEYDVARVDEIADGSMRKISVAGRDLLLARVAGRCHVVDNGCPHAGGPLAEGVLDGTVVVCPWHKAIFEPPAGNDITCFPTRVNAGHIPVNIGDGIMAASASPAATVIDLRCFAIAAAGAAGAVAAQTLRTSGYAVRIVLMGQDNELPYDRTVLNKYTVAGKQRLVINEASP